MGNKRDAVIREQVDILGRPPAEMLKKEIARLERNEAFKRLTRGVIMSLFLTVAVIIIINNMWLSVMRIDGSSMNPILKNNEIVIAVRGNNPEKNDIIAFTYKNKLHAKRVIAVAGEWVDIKENGEVTINGVLLDEPYVTELDRGNCDIELPFMVPSGEVFVLGDNRTYSLDSRDSEFGTVSRDQIIGKMIIKVWPFTKL